MKRIIFDDYEVAKIISLYNGGMSSNNISKKFKCGRQTILRNIEKYNVIIRNQSYFEKITYTIENINKIIKLYNAGTSPNQIGKLFNCSGPTITNLIRKNNIKTRDNSQCQQKYKINENIFEKIDTEEKAYWLGFLAGDGCVYRDTLNLNLQVKDLEHLKKFKKF